MLLSEKPWGSIDSKSVSRALPVGITLSFCFTELNWMAIAIRISNTIAIAGGVSEFALPILLWL